MITTVNYSPNFEHPVCAKYYDSTATLDGVSIQGLALSPDGSKIYVMDGNTYNVLVLNFSDNSLITSVYVEGNGKLIPSPDGTKLYVCLDGGGLYIIDTSTYTTERYDPPNGGVNSAGVSGLCGGCISGNGQKLFLWYHTYEWVVDTYVLANWISVFDTVSKTLTEYRATTGTTAYAGYNTGCANYDGSKAWFANNDTGKKRIERFDVAAGTLTVTAMNNGGGSLKLAMSPTDDSKIYSLFLASSPFGILVYDTTTNTLVKVLTPPPPIIFYGSSQFNMSPDGKYIYVLNPAANPVNGNYSLSANSILYVMRTSDGYVEESLGVTSGVGAFAVCNTKAVVANGYASTAWGMTDGSGLYTQMSKLTSTYALPNTPTVSGVNGATTTSVAIPAHNPGDVIIFFAARTSSTTAITIPAQDDAAGVPLWNNMGGASGTNGTSLTSRVAWTVATTSSHISGTWTNATLTAAIVISGRSSGIKCPVGYLGVTTANIGSSGTQANMSLPPIFQDTRRCSLLVNIVVHRFSTSWLSAPTGWTRRYTGTNFVVNTRTSAAYYGNPESAVQSCITSALGAHSDYVIDIRT